MYGCHKPLYVAQCVNTLMRHRCQFLVVRFSCLHYFPGSLYISAIVLPHIILQLLDNRGGHLSCTTPTNWHRQNTGAEQPQLDASAEIIMFQNFARNNEGRFSAINASIYIKFVATVHGSTIPEYKNWSTPSILCPLIHCQTENLDFVVVYLQSNFFLTLFPDPALFGRGLLPRERASDIIGLVHWWSPSVFKSNPYDRHEPAIISKSTISPDVILLRIKEKYSFHLLSQPSSWIKILDRIGESLFFSCLKHKYDHTFNDVSARPDEVLLDLS